MISQKDKELIINILHNRPCSVSILTNMLKNVNNSDSLKRVIRKIIRDLKLSNKVKYVNQGNVLNFPKNLEVK